jgi:hypothetical protein
LTEKTEASGHHRSLCSPRKAAIIDDWQNPHNDPMKLAVKRLDGDGRYETVITRDDGASFGVSGVAHAFAIPHDLAHYVVEKALRIEDGFWGSVAAGAVFPTMRHLAGRRKPKASERSSALLKTNARALVEAEVLVRIFNDTIEQGHSERSPVLAGRLRERLARPGKQPRRIGPTEVAEVYSTYKALRQDWERLPIEGILVRHW